MKHTLTFKLEKETKGALRYQEVEQDGQAVPVDSPADSRILGTIYVRKAAFKGGAIAPALSVTIGSLD